MNAAVLSPPAALQDAAAPAPRAPGEAPGTVITVRLAGETFAIDIACVREIRSFERLTHVPGAAAGVLGVINLRGSIVPVVDLRRRLGLPARGDDKGGAVLVVERPCRLDGALVDAVEDLLELEPSQWCPAPALGTGWPVRALASVGERLVPLLNMAALLRDPMPIPMPTPTPAHAVR
jgi:purine-binding chemotaxis protein CheW